jgi:hypothetical protein
MSTMQTQLHREMGIFERKIRAVGYSGRCLVRSFLPKHPERSTFQQEKITEQHE